MPLSPSVTELNAVRAAGLLAAEPLGCCHGTPALDWAFAGCFFALDTAGAAKTPNWTKALKLAEEKPNTSAARGDVIWGSSIASTMAVSSHANLTGRQRMRCE